MSIIEKALGKLGDQPKVGASNAQDSAAQGVTPMEPVPAPVPRAPVEAKHETTARESLSTSRLLNFSH